MRTPVISILLSFISISLIAQQPNKISPTDDFTEESFEDYLNQVLKQTPPPHKSSGFQSMDSIVEMRYDTTNNQWNNYSLITFKYNTQGKLTESSFNVSNNGTWQRGLNTFIFHDSNGLTQKDSTCYWSSGTNQWKPSSSSVLIYNSTGKITESIRRIWDNASHRWINSTKKEYTYNANQQKTTETFYSWDQLNQVWNETERLSFTYTSTGAVFEEIYHMWDNSTSQFVLFSKYQYYYNNTPRIDSVGWYNYNLTLSQWERGNRTEKFFYNSNDNLERHEHWIEDMSRGTFEVYNRTSATYDMNYNTADLIFSGINIYRVFHTLFPSQVNNMITEELRERAKLSAGNLSWFNDQKWIYYYSPFTISIRENSINVFSIYPNPAHDYIDIHLEKEGQYHLYLYNSNGTKLLEQAVIDGSRIDLSKFSEGAYLLKIQHDEQEHYEKIILE